ncbi:MAG: hypothetical protein AAFZ65_07545 [Planctomycetota bacterium]
MKGFEGGHQVADRVLHPYLGYCPREIADRLSRARRRTREAPDGTCSVLVVGGSVAAKFFKFGLPVLSELEPLAGYDVLRISGADGGYKQPQQVMLLAYYLSVGAVPDLVINLDGFNEVALAAVNLTHGVHPVQPSVPHWMPIARSALGSAEVVEAFAQVAGLRSELAEGLDRARASPFLSSVLVADPVLRRLEGLLGRYRQSSLRLAAQMSRDSDVEHFLGPPTEGPEDLQPAIENWLNGSRSLAGLCSAHGIAYVHVLQPTLHVAGAKPMSDQERRQCTIGPRYRFGVEVGYPLLREAGATLREEGIAFLDATDVFADVEETLYYDNCHFGAEGNRILAEAIAEFLSSALHGGALELSD